MVDLTIFQIILWAQEAIADLYEKGIINGRTEETFCPGDYVTREEFF
ncbi:MAG: S-layer homology domain-containing protein [Clostridiales bacterium]|nr:MAG: S-layer homology domain-containing protein [Clostridiales bacterium]